jgi:hypothetical protein
LPDPLKSRKTLGVRDAMAFITGEVTDEAARAGSPLSDVERRMLYFSEGPRMPAWMIEAEETFQREYDEKDYERRVAALIRAARKRADGDKKAMWSAAIARLENNDNYLCVILNEAIGRGADLRLSWRGGVAVVSLLVCFAAVPFLVSWLRGHPAGNDEVFFFEWAAMMTAALTYSACRWLFGARRVDGFIGRVIDAIFGAPKA